MIMETDDGVFLASFRNNTHKGLITEAGVNLLQKHFFIEKFRFAYTSLHFRPNFLCYR